MSLSSITERRSDGEETPRFSAPRLPLTWGADDTTTDQGLAVVAYRMLVADGTFTMTAEVTAEGPVAISELESLGFSLVRMHRSDFGTTVFMTSDGAAIVAMIGRGGVSVSVATRDVVSLDVWSTRISDRFSRAPKLTETKIRTWSLGRFGADPTKVRHDFPDWSSASVNFPSATREALGQLVALERPAGGSVMVWHGPPGTGKTTAIRALAREWAPWCDTELVIDPESLFANAGYLIDVLTSESIVDDESGKRGDAAGSARRWKLVVVEDCDGLLLRSAQSGSTGQLSRPLNVCDGLVGQELNVIVLFTTNAPVSAIHPAVIRPGRCLATVEFGVFSATEVAARGSDVEARSMSLAELMVAEGDLPDVVGQPAPDEAHGYL